MLSLVDLKKHYETPGGVVKAVDGVSLDVDAGEFVALFGPSGSGKTTLLYLAAGLLEADDGAICFRDVDLARAPGREVLDFRAEELGFVFQSFNLFPGLSALENVMLPLLDKRLGRHAAGREAGALLEAVGLSARRDNRIDRLSAGEQQRVAIARALTGKPSLILADEPTGNLDSETTVQVLALLRELCHALDTAVVLVTHDFAALDYVDRAKAMRDGKIVGDVDTERIPGSITRTTVP